MPPLPPSVRRLLQSIWWCTRCLLLVLIFLFLQGTFIQWKMPHNTDPFNTYNSTLSHNFFLLAAEDGNTLHMLSDVTTSLDSTLQQRMKNHLNLTSNLLPDNWSPLLLFEMQKFNFWQHDLEEALNETIAQMETHTTRVHAINAAVQYGTIDLARTMDALPWWEIRLMNVLWWTGAYADKVLQTDTCRVLHTATHGIASLTGSLRFRNLITTSTPTTIRASLVNVYIQADVMQQAARSLYTSPGGDLAWRAEMEHRFGADDEFLTRRKSIAEDGSTLQRNILNKLLLETSEIKSQVMKTYRQMGAWQRKLDGAGRGMEDLLEGRECSGLAPRVQRKKKGKVEKKKVGRGSWWTWARNEVLGVQSMWAVSPVTVVALVENLWVELM